MTNSAETYRRHVEDGLTAARRMRTEVKLIAVRLEQAVTGNRNALAPVPEAMKELDRLAGVTHRALVEVWHRGKWEK